MSNGFRRANNPNDVGRDNVFGRTSRTSPESSASGAVTGGNGSETPPPNATPYYQDATVQLFHGDCLNILTELPDNSVDSVVTDPPYGLEFMGKDWDKFRYSNSGMGEPDGTPMRRNTGTPAFAANRRNQKCPDCNKWAYDHADRKCTCGGWKQPAQKSYSAAFQAWCQTWATECLRVLKPGGFLVSFGGTRTFHRLTCAIEDAGFEIRDSIGYGHSERPGLLGWVYGSGFPKSLRVSRDERFCHCAASADTSSRTSPAPAQDGHTHTPDASAATADATRSAPNESSTPLDSPDGYRPAPGSDGELPHPAATLAPASPLLQEDARGRTRSDVRGDAPGDGSSRSPSPAPRSGHPSSLDSDLPSGSQTDERSRTLGSTSPADTSGSAHRTPDTTQDPSSPYATGFPRCTVCGKPNVDGIGTSLKPAWEPITVARKPLQGTVASNIERWGVGGLNIGATRIGTPGRSPSATGWTAPATGEFLAVGESIYEPHAGGRWPANVTLDTDQAQVLDRQSGETSFNRAGQFGTAKESARGEIYANGAGIPREGQAVFGYGDTGGASRFFYTTTDEGDDDPCITTTEHSSNDATGADARPKLTTPKTPDDGASTIGPPTTNTATTNLPIDGDLTARFMYTAKAATDERTRIDSISHPTVKPLSLMRWLVRLVTPPGGVILEPFAGSGTTIEAAILERFRVIAIEREADYLPLCMSRIHRRRDPIAALTLQAEDLGLFGEEEPA